MNLARFDSFSPRELTDRERSVTEWLITHARITSEEQQRYLGELAMATVCGICECGCPSFDLAIGGVASAADEPLEPFGDFVTTDKNYGVFVFAKRGHLAGVEVYLLGAQVTPTDFPTLENLEPI